MNKFFPNPTQTYLILGLFFGAAVSYAFFPPLSSILVILACTCMMMNFNEASREGLGVSEASSIAAQIFKLCPNVHSIDCNGMDSYRINNQSFNLPFMKPDYNLMEKWARGAGLSELEFSRAFDLVLGVPEIVISFSREKGKLTESERVNKELKNFFSLNKKIITLENTSEGDISINNSSVQFHTNEEFQSFLIEAQLTEDDYDALKDHVKWVPHSAFKVSRHEILADN